MFLNNSLRNTVLSASLAFGTAASADVLTEQQCDSDAHYGYNAFDYDNSAFYAFNADKQTDQIEGLCQLSTEQFFMMGMETACGLAQAEGQTDEEWGQSMIETCGEPAEVVSVDNIVKTSDGFALRR